MAQAWFQKRQVASLDKHQDNKSYCACVCLSTCMLLCAMGHHGCLWKFMVCLRLSSLGHDSRQSLKGLEA
jgi:hypothetical protein